VLFLAAGIHGNVKLMKDLKLQKDAKGRLEGLKQTEGLLKSSIAESELRIKDLQEFIRTTESDTKKLEDDLERLKVEKAASEKAVEDLQEKVSKAGEGKADLEKKLVENQRSLEVKIGENLRLTEEIAKNKTDMKKMTAKLETENTHLVGLNKSKENLQLRIVTYEKNLEYIADLEKNRLEIEAKKLEQSSKASDIEKLKLEVQKLQSRSQGLTLLEKKISAAAHVKESFKQLNKSMFNAIRWHPEYDAEKNPGLAQLSEKQVSNINDFNKLPLKDRVEIFRSSLEWAAQKNYNKKVKSYFAFSIFAASTDTMIGFLSDDLYKVPEFHEAITRLNEFDIKTTPPVDISAMEKKIRSAESTLKDKNFIKIKEKEALQKQIADQKEALTKLIEDDSSLKSQIDTLIREMDDLKNQIAAIEVVGDKATDDKLAQAKREREKSETDILDKERYIQSLQDEQARLKRREITLTDDLNKNVNLQALLESQKQALDAQIKQAQDELLKLNGELSLAQNRKDALETAISKKEVELAKNKALPEMREKLVTETAIRDSALSEKPKNDLKINATEAEIKVRQSRIRNSRIQMGVGFAGFIAGAASAVAVEKFNLTDSPESELQNGFESAIDSMRQNQNTIEQLWGQLRP
jgi:chromosome segregation ATPase